jgi:hypothetical protein
VEEIFRRFAVSQWRACVLPALPCPLPSLRMVVDPSYTANDGSNGRSPSDESSFAVGYLGEDASLTVVDCIHGRFRGMALVDRILDACELWKPETVRLEKNGRSSTDLLVDCIAWRSEMREISGVRIITFEPRQQKGKRGHTKAARIHRLQDLIDGGLLHLCPGAYIPALLHEVQQFDFAAADNHRRLDSILDSIALLAGF